MHFTDRNENCFRKTMLTAWWTWEKRASFHLTNFPRHNRRISSISNGFDVIFVLPFFLFFFAIFYIFKNTQKIRPTTKIHKKKLFQRRNWQTKRKKKRKGKKMLLQKAKQNKNRCHSNVFGFANEKKIAQSKTHR